MVKDFNFKENYNIDDLIEIVKVLRSPGGCPWDAEQNHKSIRNDLLEEAYEVADAIDLENREMLEEELGDLLLQVVFHARISEERKDFDLSAVADGICKKLIYRHPHVFGDVSVSSSSEVLDNWDALKQKEKSQTTATDTLKSVPSAFPALMRAQKVQKRAAKVGFDFNSLSKAVSKIAEETEEMLEVKNDKEKLSEEAGDLLFSVVNVVRLLGLNAEEALNASTEKFISRFEGMENSILSKNKKIQDLSIEQLDKIWESQK